MRPASTLNVHKFGGAALTDAAAIRRVTSIVADDPARQKVVVASAMLGITDALLTTAQAAAEGEVHAESIKAVRERHLVAARSLGIDAHDGGALETQIGATFDELVRMAAEIAERGELTPAMSDVFVSHGDRLAARILAAALAAAGVAAEFIDATEVVFGMGPHGNASADLELTARAADTVLRPIIDRGTVPVVPGFIARSVDGSVVTLGRGGSDLTATVLGRVLAARDVILWKDVPGLLTADPRVVPDARLIKVLHVREASELAYYGAKVLHPRSLIALQGGTRLIIRPYADPSAHGTEIVVERERKPAVGRTRRPVKALTAISDQTLLTIAGNGMVGVPGVAARAFGALERAGVSVSLISQASSEHSICMGIPTIAANGAAAALREAFAAELARGEIDAIEVRPDLATIAVVGLGMAGTPGVAARLFGALADEGVNIVAIAQGASELNISLVVEGRDAGKAQRAIHSAFRLGKIGGGAAVHPEHADVVILGFGQIGRELAAQMATHSSRAGEQVQARVVGVIDRSGYVFDARGLSAKRLEELIAAKSARTPLSGVRRGVHATAEEAIAAITGHALSRPILVDVTAGDTAPVLEQALAHGMDIVLANKRPLAGPEKDARALARAAAADGRRVLHEATVGAGLPVIDTIQKLAESGDSILRIEACPSGTLGYLFGEMGRGTSFSTALREAMRRGYTEPDPRDDLSGMDVARKALILGRLIGFSGEIADVEVESLVPESLREVAPDAFLERLHEADAQWEQRIRDARERGTVLRYRATVTKREARVSIAAVDGSSSLASLAGTDNHFSFTTRRYRANPLVITGPGAGAAVTAAGVLNDVFKLAGTR
ncbi:MAG TPA: bifunctional aspartate kinase/homoserine dehydrogenase I [Gemmatimonadaceae bacterium]|nr:bifunctional aspartate kinase/homoserine dehydrogenase I [Gemmatimonadaceae bacterium]